jgi:uncharacterized SAM-binding protein YcdF (DUF218 family)
MSLRRLSLAALLTLCAVAYLFREPILETAGRSLIVDDAPAKADAIVVLSGSFPDRILEAVALYKDGFAPKIVLCREPDNAAMDRLAELGVHVLRGSGLNRDVAEQLGVPAAAIEVVDRSAASTFSEALAALQYARDHGYASILLVTSKYHTKRAAWIYRALAGDSIRIISRPAREDSFDPDAWWHDRASTRRVLVEYQKLLVFLLLDQWKAPRIDANNLQPNNPNTSGGRARGRTASASGPEGVRQPRSLS